ncbi:MAG: 5-methylthioadenosine/S-adenosylhomocysteine deaminase [Solirubrobacteraceae bacterium]|nr:5-methylthioadenosine/S-adenosylhomocysteine deaminase [Solirubrobacteraceae bacterium]
MSALPDEPARQEVDLVIERGVVLPMTGEHDLVWDGAVAVDGGRIAAVGTTEELRRRFAGRRTIDAHEQLVMPGLVNTHMHLFGAFARGLVNELSFTPWIQKKFYVTSKGLNPDNYFLGTQFTSIEMLKTGTTAFLDCGTYQGLEEAAVRGVEAAGIRAVLARAMADVDDDLAEHLSRSDRATRENLEHAEAFIAAHDGAGDGRVRAWPCPIQVTSASDELCVGSMELAERFDVGVVTHSNVDREDIEAHGLRFGGARPIERFEALGILNRRFCGTHMARLSEREVELVIARGASAIHCPSASMKGAYGAFSKGRYPELIAAGATVGLGTDGPAAACFLDMFREVHLAATGHKEARLDWTLISPYQALELATIGSARAMLLEDEIGSLEAGKRADIVLCDLMRPEMVPWHEDNLLANLVYSASGNIVHTVLVDGRVVVRAGEVLTMDEPAILRAMQKEAPRFVALAREWDRAFAPEDPTKPHVFRQPAHG